MKELFLTFLGYDDWGRRVYRGDDNRLYKDTGNDGSFCTVAGDEIEGEPDKPLAVCMPETKVTVLPVKAPIPHPVKSSHKASFLEWAKKQTNISDSYPATGFKLGQKVIYTNEYGVSFGPMEVLGFNLDVCPEERSVYVDSDSYWFAECPSSLRPVV